MSLRRSRSHQQGFTNIDFRSKRDTNSLQIFQPWKVKHEFGTMGYDKYDFTIDMKKKRFSVSKNINTFKELNENIPDPKMYQTAQFYHQQRIKINTKQDFFNERLAQLDESPIGKDLFNGDSMMITDINKERKERKEKKKRFLHFQEKNDQMLKSLINKDKMEKNKEATQETQLVKIEAEETLANKIDIKKLQEIRLAIRRRYANRNNFRKIFKEWDKSTGGEISVFDAHTMINSFSIPINYNETRALIASSNKRGTETLNLEEFIDLIFNDNEALKVDLSKIKYKNEKLYDEGGQIENLKARMKMNIHEMQKNNDVNFLKGFFHQRIPTLTRAFKNSGNEQEYIDLESFAKVLDDFPLPNRYKNMNLYEALYNSYLDVNENKMNLKNFINDCLKDTKSNFFDFQDNYLNRITDKIERSKKEKEKYKELLKEENENKLNLKKFIVDQIIAKNNEDGKEKEQDKIDMDAVNMSIPSTGYVNKIFGNSEEMFKKRNLIEDQYSPHPSLNTKVMGKTRYGSNPPHKDTFYITSMDKKGAMYIDEKNRFDIIGLDKKVAFVTEDKKKKKFLVDEKLIRNSYFYTTRAKQCKFNEFLQDFKNVNDSARKTERMYNYELRNKIRNELVE